MIVVLSHFNFLALILVIIVPNPTKCLTSRPSQLHYSTTNNANDQDSSKLDIIAFTASLKSPTSKRYLADWRRYSDCGVKAIRQLVEVNLPHPLDERASQALTVALGQSVDEGIMPSFADPGARAGYALGLFGRARLLADLLFLDTNEPFFTEETEHKSVQNLLPSTVVNNSSSRCCKILSLGGGPGYDFVAAALVASFINECAAFARKSLQQNSKAAQRCLPSLAPLSIQATVYDYESGWSDLVEVVSNATRTVLPNESRYQCQFGGQCDITLPLSHPSGINSNILLAARTTNVFVCQYCVAENAAKLRHSNFVFFRELFDSVQEGAVVVFTETTHRVWPALVDVLLRDKGEDPNTPATTNNEGFAVSFPFTRRGRNGVCMVVRKRAGAHISEKHLEMCQTFAQHQDMNERRQKNGFARQQKKRCI